MEFKANKMIFDILIIKNSIFLEYLTFLIRCRVKLVIFLEYQNVQGEGTKINKINTYHFIRLVWKHESWSLKI